MFDNDYVLRGRHAEFADKLVSESTKGVAVFKRLVDLLYIAPIVGLLFDRDAVVESGTEKRIFAAVLNKESESLLFAFRLVLLLDQKLGLDDQDRTRQAFSYSLSTEGLLSARIESRVRGGIEVLHEHLCEGDARKRDLLDNLVQYLEVVDITSPTSTVEDLLAECRKVSRAPSM